MFGRFWNWFHGTSAEKSKVATVAVGDESIEALHEVFCQTFCHRPGVNFMAFLKAEGVTRMIDWLHPSTTCALPKALIRTAVNLTREGGQIADKPGLSLLYEGNWANGGLPPRDSLDAASVLAQILDKPIKLFYRPTPDGDLMVMMFEP